MLKVLIAGIVEPLRTSSSKVKTVEADVIGWMNCSGEGSGGRWEAKEEVWYGRCWASWGMSILVESSSLLRYLFSIACSILNP